MKILLGFIAMLFAGVVQSQATYDYVIDDCSSGRVCTATVIGGEVLELRLAYIDVPEWGQSYHSFSRFRLRGLVQGNTVQFTELSIEPLTGNRNGIMHLNGADVALYLLSQGAAYPVHVGTPQTILEAYKTARMEAAENNRGVWGAPTTQFLPWMHRQINDPTPDPDGNFGQVFCPLGIRYETECEAFPTFEDAQFALICLNPHLDTDGDGVACEESATD